MTKGRVEAFSDGVLAIAITIMVLEIKVPHGEALADLKKIIPHFISYVLSFIYVGIYWNNHHHMLHAVEKVDGKILWANMYLLFWLSLIPFATAWMGENHFAQAPMGVYGIVLLMSAIAYNILQRCIIAKNGHDSLLFKSVGKDFKGKASIVLYIIAIIASYFFEWISAGIYILVALMWLIPDTRIERLIKD